MILSLRYIVMPLWVVPTYSEENVSFARNAAARFLSGRAGVGPLIPHARLLIRSRFSGRSFNSRGPSCRFVRGRRRCRFTRSTLHFFRQFVRAPLPSTHQSRLLLQRSISSASSRPFRGRASERGTFVKIHIDRRFVRTSVRHPPTK